VIATIFPSRASAWLRDAIVRSIATRSWRWPLAALAAVGCAYAVPHLPVQPMIVTTASVPVGLYILRTDTAGLRAGDMIAFEYEAPSWAEGRYGHDGKRFAKYVFGMPGDRVITEGLRYLVCPAAGVCGEVGSAQLEDRAGRAMEPVDFGAGTTIPAGQYYMGATLHERSYDSRYYGLVPEERVIGRISPLWTW